MLGYAKHIVIEAYYRWQPCCLLGDLHQSNWVTYTIHASF